MVSTLFRASSSLSLLFILTAILIWGTATLYQNIHPTPSSPPSELRPGQVAQQLVALGRGQRMSLQVQSSYRLRITIVDGTSLEAYLKNPIPQLRLFDDATTRFDIQVSTSTYVVMCIFWNNSIIQEDKSNQLIEANHIIARLLIIGADLDILILSTIFVVGGVLIELLHRFGKSHGYLLTNKLQSCYQRKNQLPQFEKRRQKSSMRTFWQPLVAVCKKEQTRPPRNILFVLYVVTFFLVNPSKKLLVVTPSTSDLTLALVNVWYEAFQELWLFWAIILALMGIMIWKLRIDSRELSYDFSLPIKRSTYASVLFMLVVIDSTIVLLIPPCTAVILTYLRFERTVDPLILSVVLLWFIACMTLILLIGVTTGVLFPYTRLYNVTIYTLLFIGGITLINDHFLGDIILPLPSGLEFLFNQLNTGSFTSYDILIVLVPTFLLFSGIFGFYLRAVQSLEVK